MDSTKTVKRTGVISDLDMHIPKVKAGYWINLILLVLIAVVCLIPLLWTLVSAFKDTKEFYSMPPTIIPKSFNSDALGIVWRKTNLLKSYMNTFYIAAGELGFCIVINGLGGYVLSRLKPKGYRMIFSCIFWTMLMPHSVKMVPLFITFVKANLTNSFLPMWMMAGANAFNVLLFKSFFDGIPQSYLESARLDGCNNMQIFYKIIIPLSKPIIVTVSIFTVNGACSSFMWPYLLLTDEMLVPMAVKIYMLKTEIPMNEYMIAMIFIMIPTTVLFLLTQKHIMDGVNVGGIKG